ncbi:MAG: hypothetical protein RRZ64_03180 [Rikenellaceae bacterium]
MRKIGAPLAFVEGVIVKNCVISIDELSKKICNIAIDVQSMDTIASLEYFNGLFIPIVIGWKAPMNAEKRSEIICKMTIGELHKFCPNDIKIGYDNDILLIEKLNIKEQKFTSTTTIKKI